uniref:Uncharacterized protein n=1 Tax=Anguilla anguilla TaxID=7936 RepID=A0A0E9U114_ANGAN
MRMMMMSLIAPVSRRTSITTQPFVWHFLQ